MNRAARRASPAFALALVLIMAACRAGSTPPPSATEPAPTATVEPSPTAEPTATPEATAIASAEPSASASASAGELTAFDVAPHPEADALFLERDECENLDDGYRIEFPDAWWTNTQVGDVSPCAWFSPTFYEVSDPTVVPDEIAVTVEWTEGDSGSFDDDISRDFGLVGRTQPAVRVEYERADGGRYLVYQVQLGPTPEEGPNLVARTSTDMAGDYELNKAVLDRIIATMELLGSIESEL